MLNSTPLPLIWLPTGGHLGDAILITALFAEVIEANPEQKIFYVLRRNASLIDELSKRYPQVTIVPFLNAPLAALRTTLSLLTHRAVVIVPPPRNTHPLLIKILATLFLVRGDIVIGFDDHQGLQPYSKKIQYDKDARYIDNLRRALSLAPLPTHEQGAAPYVELEIEMPKDFPFEKKKYIALHPFPHMAVFKSMPLHRWKSLILTLRKDYPEYGIVVTGAAVDRTAAESIVTKEDASIYLAIDRPIRELAGLIQNSALYIGVDTGPTHLAGVLHAKSVIIAQQHDPQWLTTYNPNAVHIWNTEECTCRDPERNCTVEGNGVGYRRCVYFTTNEQIFEAIRQKLPVIG